MIAANLRLVVHWARRYQDRGVDFAIWSRRAHSADAAVDKFDWQRGFRFSTYATWWIRQGSSAGRPAARRHHPRAHGSSRTGSTGDRMTGTRHRAATRPTPEEVAEASALDQKALRSLQGVARVVASLDQPTGGDTGSALGDLVAADDNVFEEDVERRLVLDRVRLAVEGLDELERDVVRIRFGLDGGSPASLQATATRLGIGVRRARQAEPVRSSIWPTCPTSKPPRSRLIHRAGRLIHRAGRLIHRAG